MLYILCFLIAACSIFIAILLFYRPWQQRRSNIHEIMMKSEKRQQDALYELRLQMVEEFNLFQTQLSRSFQQDLRQLSDSTTSRLFDIEKNVNSNLMYGYETTSKVFGKVMQQIGKINESQENLKTLSVSLAHLQSVLTDKKTRGMYGEVELYSLLDMAMGDNKKRYACQYKLSNGSIVDAVLFGSEPLHLICIDSKFPLENYNRCMAQQANNEARKRAAHTFEQDVKKHIKTIADKYIIPHETAEFAYMFLPAEAIFSYLHANCDDVVQYSYAQKVYLVSPTTLMAYITAMKAIYIGQRRNEHAELIQKELKNLQAEFDRFEKRYVTVGNDFEKCYQDMKALQITTRKLLHRFKEIQEVDMKNEH